MISLILTWQLFFEIDDIVPLKKIFFPLVILISSPISFLKTLNICLLSSLLKSAVLLFNVKSGKKNTFVIAGGVASNKSIREKLVDLSLKEKFTPIFPPANLCSDNAAMIAMVGLEKFKKKEFYKLDYPAKPRWQLDESAAYLKGAGVKL